MAAALMRNLHLLVLVVVVLFVGGANALLTMPRLEDPRLTNRNPLVLTFLPGASAEQIEAQVTEPLERALREVAEVKLIESTSSLGVSSIAVEMIDTVDDTAPVLADLRSALTRAERSLPAGTSRPFLDDQRGAAAFGVVFALRWRGPGEPDLALLSRHADDLADRLRRVPGTEIVRVSGDAAEEVRVEPVPGELAARGLGHGDLARALAAADTRLPAGSLRGDGSDRLVELDGTFDDLDRVRAVPLVAQGGASVRVGDVADVRRAAAEPPVAIGRADGERAVFVAARMVPDRLADQWTAAVRAAAEAHAADLAGTLAVDVVFDQSRYTNARLADLGSNLALGAALVWLVVALVMGWRVGSLVAAVLPLASAGILIVLQVLGVPLHQMSMFGLLVALGLLIDNAIVMCDAVADRRRHGLAPTAAVDAAVRELALPLFASTLTTVLSFAPILLLAGNVGEFVGTIALSVIVSLCVSLALALTVVAALAGLLPLPPARTGTPAGAVAANARVRSRLAASLAHVLRPRALALLAVVPAAAGFALAPSLREQFFPAADRDQFQIELWGDDGASVAETARLVERIDAFLRGDERVTSTFWLAGQSVPSVYYNQILEQDDAPAYAQGVVVARGAAAAKEVVRRCERELARLVPEAHVVVRPFAQGPPIDAPVVLRLLGDDLDALQAGGDELRALMASAPGVVSTRASLAAPLATLALALDESALRAVGLTADDVSREVRVRLDGAAGGEVIEGTERIPVVVRGSGAERADEAALASLALVAPGVRTLHGPLEVPLAAVAEVGVGTRLPAITRRNGERVNELYGYVGAQDLPIEVLRGVLARIASAGFEPPAGVRLELGGDAAESDAATAQLVRYVPLLGTLTVATLVLVFRSVWIAALLLAVGGLSAGYGLLSLWLGGYPLGFNPLIGLAGLVGVTFNDSIVVLAAIRADADARRGERAALTRVVHGCRRHVWATTLTTAVGFVPFLVASGGDFWPPLAVVIAGGVLGATPLALWFVPEVYRTVVQRFPRLAGARGVSEVLA
jgi:multidrug efflux pump subunit AcrB